MNCWPENTSEGALWRVGRNLACFQKIEAALKSLLPAAQVSGTANEIDAQIRLRRQETKKASLGTLVISYEQRMLNGVQNIEEPDLLLEDVISLSFSIEAPPEVLKRMKTEWRCLVKERNQLVHSTLLGYDLESPEGCSALSEHLDSQYERARVLHDRLSQHQENRLLVASALKQIPEFSQLHSLIDDSSNDA